MRDGSIMEKNKKSITQIKQQLARTQGNAREELLQLYQADERAGVQSLIAQYRRMEEKERKELLRLEKMKEFEKKYQAMNYSCICGIDEAGRGPLAGPVAAGAVILPPDCQILHLNDSKKLSPGRRQMLYEEIIEKAVAYGVGMVPPERIDEINILQATYEAMRLAVEKLDVAPDMLLVDAITVPSLNIKQVGIVKGDAKSVSIAAASILAKVTRDQIMLEYDMEYPEYGFANHSGYGTAAHIAALKKYGPCPIHRKTFITHFVKE